MSTRKSIAISFLDRYFGLSIAVISSMTIARLLTPAEIGVFSVIMVLLTLVSTVRDMGTGQYLVQEKELTTARIRSVWAVQRGLGSAKPSKSSQFRKRSTSIFAIFNKYDSAPSGLPARRHIANTSVK